MKQRVVLVNDGTEHTAYLQTGLKNSGYEVIIIENSSMSALKETLQVLRPQILMLDDDRIFHLENNKAMSRSSIAA